MRSPSATLRAGLLSFLPLTMTRPSAIQRSASRREHRPARASRLAIRSPPDSLTTASLMAGSAAGGDERVEDAVVAGADRIFGMPLDPETEASLGDLDALDHAVGGQRVDHDAVAHRLDRLVMRAVDRDLSGAADAVEQGARRHPDDVAGLGARIGLLVRQRARDL